MKTRCTVYVANKGFVSRTRDIVTYDQDPQAAHVWVNLKAAERMAQTLGGFTVRVVLWYGYLIPHGVFPQ